MIQHMLIIMKRYGTHGIRRGLLKMKQVVHVIRKADVEKQYVRGLQYELDYELATLYDAMEANDQKQQVKCKQRLIEIHHELEKYNAFA